MGFIRAAWPVLHGGEALGDEEAQRLFDERLLGRTHHGAETPAALRKRRSRRDELGHRNVHRWVCAAIEAIIDAPGSLDPEEFQEDGDLVIPEHVVARHVSRPQDLDDAVDRLQSAAGALEELCHDLKLATSAAGRGGKRRPPNHAAPGRVQEWLTGHPRVHRLEDAAFIYERRDTLCEVLERLAEKGSVAPLAAILPQANHYLHVFEEHELRRRLSRLVATAESDGRPLSPATRLLTLVEGEGWALWRGHAIEELKDRILIPELEDGELPEALARAKQASDAVEVRRALLATCTMHRLKGLLSADAATSMREFERGARLAWQARHESLTVSIAVDSAERLIELGRVGEATERLLWAEQCAMQQGNDRRLFRVYCAQAVLAAKLGEYLHADARLRLAEALLERFALYARLLLPGAPRTDWYQPGYKELLRSIEATMEEELRHARSLGRWDAVTKSRPED